MDFITGFILGCMVSGAYWIAVGIKKMNRIVDYYESE